jgi:hypothetical protein
MRAVYVTVATILFMLSVTPAVAQLTAMKTDVPIRLDGRVIEDAWKHVEPVTEFRQRELVEGAPVSERTELYILHDAENLYIGVICYDSEPDKIIHKELSWDSNLSGDDYITFILDTYNDKRSAYYFSVNPNGATYDGTFVSGDEHSNGSWEGIWDARSYIGDFGWSCEIIMPYKTLKFPATSDQTWGFNFRRKIRRKDEWSLWQAWKQNEGILMLSKAGTLHLPGPVRSGRQIDLKPYLLSGVEDEDGSKPRNTFKYGLDARYGITSNTTLELTTNTDFAQIESDREVVNLSRYDIGYREKRPFFLEGSEFFTFFQGMTSLFYSRRIGISPGRQLMPIIAGGKLSQKNGGFRLGIMSVQTEADNGYPGTNYTVARMKKDILEQSHIGLIVTSIIDGDRHDNQVIGADLEYRTNSLFGDRNFAIQSYLTGSVTDGSAHESYAGRLALIYPNDVLDGILVYHALGNEFNPEMGFIYGQEPGVQEIFAMLNYMPRTSIPYIKKFDFQPFMFNHYTDTKGNLTSRTLRARPFGFITNADDTFSISVSNRYEIVDKKYGIYGDIIPLGVHEWLEYRTSFSSSWRRPVSVNLNGQTGDFYNGTRNVAGFDLKLKPSQHYAVSVDANYSEIKASEQTLITREYGSRIELFFTSRMNASTFVQYNNETNRVNVNFRFHFIPKIGSDIYLVYNSLLDEDDEFRTLQNAAMLKVNATIRL